MQDRTFAYLLCVGKTNEGFEGKLNGWYFGDIIEAFSEAEDQARKPADIWSFNWDEHLSRVAPVQLTRGLDVRPLLLAALPAPNFRFETEGLFGGSTFIFSAPSVGSPAFRPPQASDDQSRFYAVLRATVSLAVPEKARVVFVGGWGWYYDMEVPAKQQRLLKKMGMPFVTRHV